jgi:translation initiation factor 2B subunit (eIF-2B alpha/beta/delta family)
MNKKTKLSNSYLKDDDEDYSQMPMTTITEKSPIAAIELAIKQKSDAIDKIKNRIEAISKKIEAIGDTIDEKKLASVKVLKSEKSDLQAKRLILDKDKQELEKILLHRQMINKETADVVVYDVIEELRGQFKKSISELQKLHQKMVASENVFNILLKQADKGDLTATDSIKLRKQMIKASQELENLREQFKTEYTTYNNLIKKYTKYEPSFRATVSGLRFIEEVTLNHSEIQLELVNSVNTIIKDVRKETANRLIITDKQLAQLEQLEGMKSQLLQLKQEQEKYNRHTSQDKEIIKELEGRAEQLSESLGIIPEVTEGLTSSQLLSPTQKLTLEQLNTLKPDKTTRDNIMALIKELEASKIRGSTGLTQAFIKMTEDYSSEFKNKFVEARIDEMLTTEKGMTAIRDFLSIHIAKVIGIQKVQPYLEKLGEGRRVKRKKQVKQLTKKQMIALVKKIRRIGGGHESESSSSDEDF